MKDKEGNELVTECARANSQIIFDEQEDEGYLVRYAKKYFYILSGEMMIQQCVNLKERRMVHHCCQTVYISEKIL